MNKQESTLGLSVRDRAKQALRSHRALIECAVYTVTGFVSANAFVLADLAPFGIAFAAAAKPQFYPAAVIGSILGYVLSFSSLGNVKYVLASMLLFAVRWAFSSGTLMKNTTVAPPVLTAVSLGIPSLAIAIATGGDVYAVVLVVSEVLLACCASYFFARTIQSIDLGWENLQQTDITSMIITFCITVIALINLQVAGLSVGRIIAVITILLAAQAANEAGGAISGVAGGVAAGVIGANSFLMGTYGFGGLLAGVFAPLGKIASAVAFIVVNTFALLASRQTINKGILLEIFIASAVSILIPSAVIKKITLRKITGSAVQGETYRQMIHTKMQGVSSALRQVATTTRKVNEKLDGMRSGDISCVYTAVADKICRKCKRNCICWQQMYTDTSNVFNDALVVMRQNGTLTLEDIPDYFTRQCLRLEEMIPMLNRAFEEYTAQEAMKRKVAQVRGVVTDQFEGMALMIDSMGSDLDELVTQDDQTAARVKEYLHSLAIYPETVSCTVNDRCNMTLEFSIPIYKLSRIDLTDLTVQISDLCGRDFDLPAKRTTEKTAVLTFVEKAVYTVKWGATQLGNSCSRLCGDSYTYVPGNNGRMNIILSDGMGSGGAAAVDSALTSELLKQLIEAGVSLDAALKLVNSALLVKTGDESLATIDIAGIDLYTGQVDFYKAGAAPTFLRKSGKGGYVESNSLPVGILGGVAFEKNSVTLKEGDLIVMVSDGAVASGYDWILSDLEHYEGKDPKILSEKIVCEAQRRRLDGHEDDITAIVIMLEKGI